MKKRLRIGIIGCGAITSRVHIPDYAVCPEAELVAFCDVAKKRAKGLAKSFAPKAGVYTDYEKMLAEANLDAVTIGLPNALHAPAALAAIEAGCHVLVEKPMAASLEECQRMIDAAKAAGVLLMVSQLQRLTGVHRKAKEVLDEGKLGKILHVSAMFGHAGPEDWCPEAKWFFSKKDARFGAMADLGVHKADLIRYLTGKEVAEIGAFYERLEKKDCDVEDNFVSCLKFTDGTVGTLAASWTVKGERGADYIILHCAKGSLFVNVEPERPVVAYFADRPKPVVYEPLPPCGDTGWGLDESGLFCRAILGKEAPFCTGEEGMKSLAIIFAAEEAADTGKTVKLKHGKGA